MSEGLRTWDCVGGPAEQVAARDAFYRRLQDGLEALEVAFGVTVVEHVIRELNAAADAADDHLERLAIERVQRHAE